MKLVWSFDAKEDLQNLHLHYASHGSGHAAKELLKRIRKSALLLLEFPRLGKSVVYSPRMDAEIRMILVGRIKIYYIFKGAEIRIMRVWDGRQDPDKLVL
jgi:plasmid stabilization system protein ParE